MRPYRPRGGHLRRPSQALGVSRAKSPSLARGPDDRLTGVSPTPGTTPGPPSGAGTIAGYLADRAAVPGVVAGLGYTLPSMAVLLLDPWKSSTSFEPSLSGLVLLLVIAPIVGVLGSNIGSRLASGPATSPTWVVRGVLVAVVLVTAGAAVIAARTIVTGCGLAA